jgi:peptidoglycan hydrolase-like protein with peptidoglycan-binding domain
MLVQHALNTVMAQLSLVDSAGRAIHYLHRDGYMGPKTSAAIASFQKYLTHHRRLVKADGSVDPASADGWTRDGNAQYTIIWLNRTHRDIHGRMMKEKDFPELLQADVKKHALEQGFPVFLD